MRQTDIEVEELTDYELLLLISEQYDNALNVHGNCPKGVLWSEDLAQIKRFDILSSVIEFKENLSINDLGCGYGAFFDYLKTKNIIKDDTVYYGYDISLKMLKAFKEAHAEDKNIVTAINNKLKSKADYSFASGTFSLNLGMGEYRWKTTIKESISNLYLYSNIACAFNLLDKNYKDKHAGLFYADKDEFLEFCNEISENKATIITDYCKDDFTIVIKK